MTMDLERSPGRGLGLAGHGGGALATAAKALPAAPKPKLGGVRKAAVLLVSLGPEAAAEVFRHLADDEIEELSLEMAKLDWVEPAATSAVREELLATIQAYESLAVGGIDYAQEVLQKALGPERSAEIIGRLTSVIEKRPFEFLRRAPPDQIANFLAREAPQTTALVVAHLHKTLAAQVLSSLPDALQAEVGLRIARMEPTAPEVVKQVEAEMRKELSGAMQHQAPVISGVESIAQILTHGERSTERNVLDSLGETDADLAEEIRRLLFTFEDIVRLDDRSIQLVLREADQKDLALAMRGVADEIRERILANMSSRGAEMLIEELQVQPPQRKRVVEDAQGRIVAIIRRLEEAGSIILARSEEDVVL